MFGEEVVGLGDTYSTRTALILDFSNSQICGEVDDAEAESLSSSLTQRSSIDAYAPDDRLPLPDFLDIRKVRIEFS